MLHGPSLVFLPRTRLPLPLKGGGAGYHLSWVGRVGSVRSKLGHAGSTGPTLFLAGVAFPTWSSKPDTGPHRAKFDSHRRFLVRFGSGIAAKSRSSLQLTASWMGRIVKSRVPFRTSPVLVRTLVGSTLISRLSSSCLMFFTTVLALIPVYWLMRPMLGQHWCVFLSSQKIR